MARTSSPVSRLGFAKIFLTVFLPVLALFLGTSFLLFRQDLKHGKEALEKEAIFSVQKEKEILENKIRSVIADLMLLATSHEILKVDEGDGGKDWEALGRDFLQLARHKGVYDQVRFIDSRGYEKVRVNYNRGRPAVVPERDLQFKGDRYYFLDAMQLGRERIFLSPLDLNIEQEKIEIPLKPILRFATPIYDCAQSRIGLVVLNYLGSHLMDGMEGIAGGDQGGIMLVNAEGHWLKGLQRGDEWGFMFPGREHDTFPYRFPEAWEKINSAESGQFSDRRGLYSFSTIYPLLEGMKSSTGTRESSVDTATPAVDMGSYYWKMVSFLPASAFRDQNLSLIAAHAAPTGMTFLLLVGGCILLAYEISRRKTADLALKDAKATLDNVFDNSIPLCVTSLNHEIILSNRAYEENFGPGPPGGKAVKCYESRPGPTCHTEDCPLEQIKAGKDNVTCEPVKTAPDGRKEYFLVTARPFRDREGKLTGILESFQDITHRRLLEEERDHLIAGLKSALADVKKLSGFLPICASCKKIRDDKGYWKQIEAYIRDHSEAEFSHGICPDCIDKLYPGILTED